MGSRGGDETTSGDARADAVHRLEQEVGVLLRRVRRAVGERARLVHADLHPSAYFLLAHINEHGPIRASALVEAMDLDKGAMSRGVQHLIALGLVERTPDPADGRATLLSVSAEGRTRLADMAVHRRKRLDERLSGWSDAELGAFVSELARYNATLD